MPQTMRVTYLFSGKSQGWGESYIYPVGDSITPLQAYTQTFDNIANLRAQMLGREYTLDFVRVAIIYNSAGSPVKRAVLLRNPGYTPALQTAVNSAEQPNACALISWTDTTGQRKKHTFLGGPPDEIFDDAGVYRGAKASNWASRFSAWTQAQFAAGVGWLQDLPTGPGSNVTGVTFNANLTKTFNSETAIFEEIEIGQRRNVRVSGINGKSRLNGAWVVLVTGVTSCTTIEPVAAAPYSTGGHIVGYTFPKPISQAQTVIVNREGTHKRGRPMVATRGRLPAQPRV